jgi:hypothetical protein
MLAGGRQAGRRQTEWKKAYRLAGDKQSDKRQIEWQEEDGLAYAGRLARLAAGRQAIESLSGDRQVRRRQTG